MPLPADKTRVNTTVTKAQLRHMERLAKKLDLPVATLATNLMSAGLDDALLMEKLGVLSTVQTIRNFAARHTALTIKAAEASTTP
jgi:hypothetical protein